MRVLGHVRNSGAVVSTDETQLEIVRRERARRKEMNSYEKRIARLEKKVEELERKLSG